MYLSNYRDFYQKAIVPIGANDTHCIEDFLSTDSLMYSHWLIALEGSLTNQETEYYCWKVTIYPSDCNGRFTWNTVLYTSTTFDSIHDAYIHAKTLEDSCKNDHLHLTKLGETSA